MGLALHTFSVLCEEFVANVKGVGTAVEEAAIESQRGLLWGESIGGQTCCVDRFYACVEMAHLDLVSVARF